MQGKWSLLLLANATYNWQICDATAIKSGHVIAWKAVEAKGISGSGHWYETINLVCLALGMCDTITLCGIPKLCNTLAQPGNNPHMAPQGYSCKTTTHVSHVERQFLAGKYRYPINLYMI